MVVKFNFLSKELMMQTNVTMILPSFTLFDSFKGKAESYLPGTKFQTLYLFHGGTGDDSDYINFSNILRYADDHKIAVIMPSGYNSSYEDESEDFLPWPRRYWTYVFEELPRVCTAMFPLSTKREDTFAAGLSMGSMAAAKWAVYGGERIGAALLLSGGGMDTSTIMRGVSQSADKGGNIRIKIDPERLAAEGIKLIDTESDLYKTARKNAETGKLLPKIIMACGRDDLLLPIVYACRDEFRGYGYDVKYEEFPGYAHEWDFWDMALRKAFEEWLPIRHDVLVP
ncbi:MAG: hypothetical protein LBQ46_09290 [Treponema sp.]|jgi:S-formylglutathione hydrolase FrmB|nr:hypothetical protein [Treponema sp.]